MLCHGLGAVLCAEMFLCSTVWFCHVPAGCGALPGVVCLASKEPAAFTSSASVPCLSGTCSLGGLVMGQVLHVRSFQTVGRGLPGKFF